MTPVHGMKNLRDGWDKPVGDTQAGASALFGNLKIPIFRPFSHGTLSLKIDDT
jgi:hypothetical protein